MNLLQSMTALKKKKRFFFFWRFQRKDWLRQHSLRRGHGTTRFRRHERRQKEVRQLVGHELPGYRQQHLSSPENPQVTCPNLSTKNQIDHVRITQKSRRSLQDVCTGREADFASDHHFVVAHLKLGLKRMWTGEAGHC